MKFLIPINTKIKMNYQHPSWKRTKEIINGGYHRIYLLVFGASLVFGGVAIPHLVGNPKEEQVKQSDSIQIKPEETKSEKERKYLQVLGVHYWEVLNLGINTQTGKSAYPGIEEKKEKARQILRKHDSNLEIGINNYIVQSTNESRKKNLTEKEKCLICGEKYRGAYSLCGVCGYVYREEFMKKR